MAPKQIAVAQALYHVIPFIPMTVEIVAPELVLIVLMPMNMTAAKPILTTAEMRVLVPAQNVPTLPLKLVARCSMTNVATCVLLARTALKIIFAPWGSVCYGPVILLGLTQTMVVIAIVVPMTQIVMDLTKKTTKCYMNATDLISGAIQNLNAMVAMP